MKIENENLGNPQNQQLNIFVVMFQFLTDNFINMENDKKILLGKKCEDKYKGWILPPNTWITIQKMWGENGKIKIWNKKIQPL